MHLLFKFVIFIGLVNIFSFIAGSVLHAFGFSFTICMLASCGIDMILCILVIYLVLLKPLDSLYISLRDIDFDRDIIDFSKLDSLQLSGAKEVKFLQNKFKYLLDIITERINRVNSQTYKSEHDSLTGLYNRTHLEVVKTTYEMQEKFSIIFVDVNNLKKMNDEFGHEAGDALLRNATRRLNFWINYGDVYRVGGDEFMVVVLNRDSSYVEKLIDMWYTNVGVLNRDSDGFKCALSYGVAHGVKGSSFDIVQTEADERMYNMKVSIKKEFGEPLR